MQESKGVCVCVCVFVSWCLRMMLTLNLHPNPTHNGFTNIALALCRTVYFAMQQPLHQQTTVSLEFTRDGRSESDMHISANIFSTGFE